MVGAGIGGGLFLVTIVIIGEHENFMCIMVSLYRGIGGIGEFILVTIIIIGELFASKMMNTRISFKSSKYEEKR